MMRIKEAIQRRKLIQQLNDDYTDDQIGKPGSSTPSLGGHRKSDDWSRADSDASAPNDQITSINLHHFVGELSGRLTEHHRRALRVTWRRLSEAPKTSGRGTLQIMEKMFERLLDAEPEIMKVFYRSAFLKCVDDRKRKCASGTIATIRDHAHLIIDFIDAIMAVMFDLPMQKPVWDPATIGRAHARLIPLGFRRQIWHKLGEIFAESMFSQDCVRAFPSASSAWSIVAVFTTETMFFSMNRPTRLMALTPYTPSSFSSWSSPPPYALASSTASSGYNSHVGGASPASHRSRARSRTSNRSRRHHRRGSTTPASSRSRNSSRSTSAHRHADGRSRHSSRQRRATPRR